MKKLFTKNKQIVRNLQLETILSFFGSQASSLTYFGLTSREMRDVLDWSSLLGSIYSVERGRESTPELDQHAILVNAFKGGILSKTHLLRGDIDEVILDGKDDSGIRVPFNFDIVSLDYSGGLFYRDKRGSQFRLKAIEKIIDEQSKNQKEFLLFISTNDDQVEDLEIKKSFADIRTELNRMSMNADLVCKHYLEHKLAEVRLKIYVPYFVNGVSAGRRYNVETEKPIFYLGNNGTRMMNFRFRFRLNRGSTSIRMPRQSLVSIFNSPMIQVRQGRHQEVGLTSLGIPKLKRLGTD